MIPSKCGGENDLMPTSIFRDELFSKILDRLDRLDREAVQNFLAGLISELEIAREALSSIREGIIVCDTEGTIKFTNNAVHDLIGLPRPTPLGEPLTKYLRNFDERILSENTGTSHIELEVNYPARRRLRIVALARTDNERLLILDECALGLHEMRELAAQERLQGVMSLAAAVAHEIGNPLNSMRIHLQLLKRDLPAAKSKKTLSLHSRVDVALEEIRRLDGILHQFLKAVRPAPPALRPCSLNSIITDTLDSMSAELQSREIRANVTPDPNLPPAMLDPDQIKQVLYNLIRNAIQASSNGSQIDLSTSVVPGGVAVQIRDYGCGMTPEVLSRVFEPYFTTKESGSGLGLYVVRRIVREHGGSIEVSSNPGQGTCVTVKFPAPEAARLLAAPENKSPQ